MKANFIIGKKQIILASLVVILSGAVYLNYVYANENEDFSIVQTLNAENPDAAEDTPQDSEEESKNYGDTQLVNNDANTTNDYFAQAQLQRTKSRDEAIETVKSVLISETSTEEETTQANAQITQITQQIESETKIENLIKAKGFEDCVVYLSAESANIVVKTEGLDATGAAQIKNIILSEQELKPENISIVEVK